jgi:hypothetical protein
MPLPEAPGLRAARLESALLGTSRILTVTSSLSSVLAEILDLAAVAVPHDASSVLVRTEGADDVVCGTDAAVESVTVDAVTRLARSPLLDALTTGGVVAVGRIPTDPRWPSFGRRAANIRARSLVATGVVLDERTSAVLTHWSGAPDAFDDADLADAVTFASTLAPVLVNTTIAEDLRRRNENLTHALASRAVIDQAIGIVMSRTGCTAEQAFDRLRGISQREHVKVHEVAQRTVRDAVNRTRARMLQSRGPATAGAVS